jgi:hypothetical protein
MEWKSMAKIYALIFRLANGTTVNCHQVDHHPTGFPHVLPRTLVLLFFIEYLFHQDATIRHMEDVDVRRRTETNEIRQHTGHDIHVPDHDHMTVSDFICVFGKLRNSHPDTAIPLFFYDYS